jgi:hypothetical protein
MDSEYRLIIDERNANKGTERGRAALLKSLREYGAGRAILADANGNIIAGNKTYTAARLLELGIQVVHSDGQELVVVQRDDLDLETDPEARLLAFADNRVGELDLSWDAAIIAQELADGLDLSEMFMGNEAARILANELDSDLVIDSGDVIHQEWNGMPEFDNPDRLGITIELHFANEAEVQKFAALIDQPITPQTRYLWIPRQEKEKMREFVAHDES